MNNSKKPIAIMLLSLFFTLLPDAVLALSNTMEELDEMGLREVSGRGLFVADMVKGDELAGANEYSTPFNFYRVGMDGEMKLNLNISKLQLGCGGVNDLLSGHAGCDIDIDYATMMGRDPETGTDPGDPVSAFILDRPYMEFAIKNDDTRTMREVVGIKIGAARADGAITGGRRYSQSMTNHENTAFATGCDPDASTGSGVVGCHSGINSVSGFLGAEMSLTMGVNLSLLINGLDLYAVGCTGRTQNDQDACGESLADATFVDMAGTRMQTLGLRAASLKANDLDATICGGLSVCNDLLNSIFEELSAQMSTDLRSVHKMTLEDTPDFFLSFQREPVAYPRYSKITPIEELTAATAPVYDVCATGQGGTMPRCNSGYAVPANTGWWLNIPTVKLLDVENMDVTIHEPLDLGNVVEILGAPGWKLSNPEFNLTPAVNCYGSTSFC